jgi:hypothetical protein
MKKYRIVFRGEVKIHAESPDKAKETIKLMLYDMYLRNNIDYREGKYRLIAGYEIEKKKNK